MHPVLFKLLWMGREVVISAYGVMMIIALAAGTGITLLVARKRSFNTADIVNYCMLVIAGIIFGALLTGYLLFLPERAATRYIDYPTALVSWGGILGGLAALVYIAFKRRERFLVLADIFTPGYLLGLGIGRIGCLFAGCCYGVHTSSCTGVTFTDPLAPASAMAQPLVPTQAISAAFLICAGAVFILPALKCKAAGFTFSVSAITYALFRFTIEFWRDDPRLFVFGLSDGQVFSLAYFMMGIGIMVYIFLTSPPNPLSRGRGRAGGGVRS